MTDIRISKPRTGVQIWLHSADICDILTQPEVLANFTGDELKRVEEGVTAEVMARKLTP